MDRQPLEGRELLLRMLHSHRPRMVPCQCKKKSCREFHFDGEPEHWADILDKLAHARMYEARQMIHRARKIRRMMKDDDGSWL